MKDVFRQMFPEVDQIPSEDECVLPRLDEPWPLDDGLPKAAQDWLQDPRRHTGDSWSEWAYGD